LASSRATSAQAWTADKKEGTAKSRPFLTIHPDAAIYPGEVSAPEQGD